jgi:predicted phosphodiesterase
MKISVCSDLHLEFGELELFNTDDCDVLVLAGDICVVADLLDKTDPGQGFMQYRSERYHKFFQECCARWKNVIYVMGNHEHYGGDIAHTANLIRERLGYLVNLHIMEQQSIVIEDIRFICGTLWTDMNSEDLETINTVRRYMNDFKQIKDSRALVHYKDTEGIFRTRIGHFSPEQSVVEHKAMMSVIKEQAPHSYQNIVVVGHHAPTKLSTHPRYQKDVQVNGAYSSNLTEFILDHPRIKVWIHGHTHDGFDYQIGSCRVVCNPRGYVGYEQRADVYQPQTIEVSNL